MIPLPNGVRVTGISFSRPPYFTVVVARNRDRITTD